MSELLRRLLALFLHPGVEEGDPEPSASDDAAPSGGDETLPAEGSDEPTLDDLVDAAPVKEPDEDVTALRLRAERAERALAERSAPPAPAAPAARDADYDREEAQLAQARQSGASPEQLSWLQWQIDSNRKMRSSERTSQQALQRAQDLADKADFDRLEVTKPKLYAKYAKRVEDTLADMRAKGQPVVPRTVILRLFLGDDLMNNKVKAKERAPASAPATTVPRVRPPAARSDVNARASRQSEHQKRIERLKNQFI